MNSKIKHLLCANVIAFISILITLLGNPYRQIDNMINSIFLNNMYDNDYYCAFVHPLCVEIVKIIDSIFTNADGYVLGIRLVSFLCYWWIAYLILKMKPKCICYWLMYIVMTIGFNIPNQNFTVRAAMFASVGFFTILLTFYRFRNKKYYMIGLFFIFIALLGRKEASLLMLPYIILCIFLFVLENKGELNRSVIRVLSYFVPIALVMITMIGTKGIISTSPKHIEDTEFNNYRSSVVDYSIKSYVELKKNMPDLTENDYELLVNRFVGDTDKIDSDYLKKIANVANIPNYNTNIYGVIRASVDSIRLCLKGEMLTKLLFILCGLIGIYILIFISDIYDKIEVILSGLGTWIIFIYFEYKGRLLDRVAQPVLLAILVIFLISLFKQKENIVKFKKNKIIICMIILCTIYPSISFVRFMSSNQVTFAVNCRANEDEYSYGDDIYIWSTGDFCGTALWQFVEKKELPSASFIKHNYPWGASFCSKNFYYKHLGGNPIKKLLEKNYYFVSNNPNSLITYYNEHYNIDVKATRNGNELGFKIWELDY